MSIAPVVWAMHQKAGDPLDKLILMFMADWGGAEGEWYFNLSKMADYSEVSTEEVSDAIFRLEETGLIYLRENSALLCFERPEETPRTRSNHLSVPSVLSGARLEVYERDGFRCVYCGSADNLTIDHLHPRSRGGSNEVDNLATACKSCNSQKGAKTREEYEAWLSKKAQSARELFS